MKTKLTLLFSLLLVAFFNTTNAQINSDNYQLFNANDQKYFADETPSDSVYNIAFDTIYQDGEFIRYENYQVFGEEFYTENCGDWSPYCFSQNAPSWIGEKILNNETGTYHFFNASNDTISININILEGDSSLMYQDEDQLFYVVADGEQMIDIFGNEEQTLQFHISHFDSEGNVISSPIHNQSIIIGENSGLTNFCRIDLFPDILQPVSIIGDLNSGNGFIGFTHELVYDFQVGDVFQYNRLYSENYPPEIHYHSYEYLNRYDTEDSIYYTIKHAEFADENISVEIDTIYDSFKKSDQLFPFPYDMSSDMPYFPTKGISQRDFGNGNLRWSYSHTQGYQYNYCETDDAWCDGDNDGALIVTKSYAFGIGKVSDDRQVFGGSGGTYWDNLIYYKKGDEEWGNEIVLGNENLTHFDDYFQLYPNPASDHVILDVNSLSSCCYKIINTNGQVILSGKISNINTNISTSELQPGMYIFQVINNKGTFAKKFFIQ